MNNLVIIGAGGFGLELLDLIEDINEKEKKFNLLGFLDDNKAGFVVPNISVIGKTSDIDKYKDCTFVIGLSNPITREKYFDIVNSKGLKTPNLVHPSVKLSNYVDITDDVGVVINSNSIIAAKVRIGKGTVIDSNVYVGHESTIGDFVSIYSGALIAGNVVLENCVQIGLGSKVIQGNTVGENSFIGAGSTVIKNIEKNVIAVGTPCVPVRGI